MSLLTLLSMGKKSARARRPFQPRLEALEQRWVPYSASGYWWANSNVSFSFLPDGTYTEGYSSSLFATLDKVAPTAVWQAEFARALQTWANVSNLNFHLVSDDGSPTGTSGLVQGDSRFGDIRLGAHPLSGYVAYAYYPGGSNTKSGDITLNPNYTFKIGSNIDLYSVFLHEIGHALGLGHSTSGTVMYSTISGVYSGLTADDIAGIQSIYGVRRVDAFDGKSANDSISAASVITVDTYGAATFNADLTTLADVDYYRFTAPSSFNGTLTVSLHVSNLSLLAGKLQVFDANGNLLASGAAAKYGSNLQLTVNGLQGGQTCVVMVDGAANDAFGMGAYSLSIQFGGVTVPATSPSPTPSPTPTGPTADRYETNDAFSAASKLGRINGSLLTGLSIHNATDVDFFQFVARSTATYQFTAMFSHSSGNLDIALYNANMQLIAAGNSFTDNETIQASLTSGQTYYIKVVGVNGAMNNYDLNISKSGGGGTGNKPRGVHWKSAVAGHGSYAAGYDLLGILDEHDHDHLHHRDNHSCRGRGK